MAEEKFKELWNNLDKEKLKADPEKIEFVYDNAMQLIKSKEKVLDRCNRKSTILLTGCILLITSILSISVGIPNSKIEWVHASLFPVIMILLIYSLCFFLGAFMISTYILRAGRVVAFPYLPPSNIFSKNPYVNSKSTKIGIIPLLEDIIDEKHKLSKKQDSLFILGLWQFLMGITLLFIVTILFLINILVIYY